MVRGDSLTPSNHLHQSTTQIIIGAQTDRLTMARRGILNIGVISILHA